MAARRLKRGAFHTFIVPAHNWRTRRLDDRLRSWAAIHPTVQVIQIGSHDGLANDPLDAHLSEQGGWKAVLVEPIPTFFSQLTAYRKDDPRFTLVCAAITDHNGKATMVTPQLKSDNHLLGQASSLDPEHVRRHLLSASKGQSSTVELVEVDCITFQTLLDRCGIKQFDLLHIDAEGHDAVILRQVDIKAHSPSVVLFEHCHLSKADRKESFRTLRNAGFRVTRSHTDALAIVHR